MTKNRIKNHILKTSKCQGLLWGNKKASLFKAGFAGSGFVGRCLGRRIFFEKNPVAGLNPCVVEGIRLDLERREMAGDFFHLFVSDLKTRNGVEIVIQIDGDRIADGHEPKRYRDPDPAVSNFFDGAQEMSVHPSPLNSG